MKTIYIKKNGVTKVSDEETKKEENKAVLINKMRIFDFIDEKGVTLTDKSLKTFTSYLDYLGRKDFKDLYSILSNLTNIVINVEDSDGLIGPDGSLYNSVNNMIRVYSKPTISMVGYYSRLNKKTNMVFERNLSVMITVAKEVIKRFVKASLENYTEEQLNNINSKISEGQDPLDFVIVNDIKLSDIEDKSLKAFTASQFKYYLGEKINKNQGYCHLCGDCSVGIQDCPKVMDIPKKNIAEYDFITDGIQETHTVKNINTDDPYYPDEIIEETDMFLVTKCKKYYKKEHKDTKSKIQRVRIVKK